MNALKAIQSSFYPTKHGYVDRRRRFANKKYSLISLCKSNDDAGSNSSQGDTRKQELLAKIAMLQTQKVRLTDYLDERSEYLTQFAEDANAEFDEIGENALKGLDEAGTRIMENLESRIQAFEETAESNKVEIEKNERKLVEFEGQIEEDRNEGLFFKNLGQKAPEDRAKAEEEMKKIKQVTKETAGSRTRRNIYLALTGLLIIGIADALIASPSDWRKIAILGAIVVGLVSRFLYEQRISSETDREDEK